MSWLMVVMVLLSNGTIMTTKMPVSSEDVCRDVIASISKEYNVIDSNCIKVSQNG